MFVEDRGGQMDQLRQRAEQGLIRTPCERYRGQSLVDHVETLELERLPVQDRAQYLGEDVIEHDLGGDLDDRKAEAVGGDQHLGRQRLEIGARLDPQAGQAAFGQCGNQPGECGRVVAYGVGGGQQKLAAPHPPHDVGDLHDVDHPDPACLALLTGHQARTGQAGQAQGRLDGDAEGRPYRFRLRDHPGRHRSTMVLGPRVGNP